MLNKELECIFNWIWNVCVSASNKLNMLKVQIPVFYLFPSSRIQRNLKFNRNLGSENYPELRNYAWQPFIVKNSTQGFRLILHKTAISSKKLTRYLNRSIYLMLFFLFCYILYCIIYLKSSDLNQHQFGFIIVLTFVKNVIRGLKVKKKIWTIKYQWKGNVH